MGKTMAEKILSRHAGREVQPGDIISVEITDSDAHDLWATELKDK